MKIIIHTHTSGYSTYFKAAHNVVCEVQILDEEDDNVDVFVDNISTIHPNRTVPANVIDKLNDETLADVCYTDTSKKTLPPCELPTAESLLKAFVMAAML